MALLLQDIERESHVLRRERRTVVEFGAGADEKLIDETIGRAGDFLRSKAVHPVRLVAGADHQRGEGQLHALGGVALENESVERIKREKILVVETVGADLRKPAALWRVWIDVAEVRKIARVGEIAERREPVRLDHVGGAGLRYATIASAPSSENAGAELERPATGELGHADEIKATVLSIARLSIDVISGMLNAILY